ncbi:MAG: ribonuclease, partial [Flaviaesturariibacter sp.]|nr:ribonuclease [Flaviaesturariibacter sp.]
MGRKNGKKTKEKETRGGGGQGDTYQGRLEITRSGMGFVVVENMETDILIRPNDFNTALHGDTVRVRAVPAREGKRMQGEVVTVLERKQSEFIGRLQMNKGFAFFVADTERKVPDIFVPESNFNGAVDNDRVVVRVSSWESGQGKRPVGTVVNVLAAEDVNDAAMKEILLQIGFALGFDDDVLEDTARIPDIIPDEEIARRKDFRKILTFTIDPVDAKDFDDALSIRVLKNGNYEIGVHIADVSHYVEPDTALD